jgi:hypothetical protein
MLRRLWFVLAGTWAALFLFNGFTKVDGPRPLDFLLAFAPVLILRVLRFIVWGPKPRVVVYRNR